jgi:hypothetical protein
VELKVLLSSFSIHSGKKFLLSTLTYNLMRVHYKAEQVTPSQVTRSVTPLELLQRASGRTKRSFILPSSSCQALKQKKFGHLVQHSRNQSAKDVVPVGP